MVKKFGYSAQNRYIALIINVFFHKNAQNLIRIFSQIEDPRSHINRLHNLVDILAIGIMSVIAGTETWKQMSEFAKSKEAFQKTYFELPNGIPSKDTINHVLSAIDSEQFEACSIEWISSVLNIKTGQTIAIDGKTVHGAKSHEKKSPIYSDLINVYKGSQIPANPFFYYHRS